MASSETEKDDIAVTVDVEQAQEFDTADIVLDTVHASHEYTDAQYKNLLRKIDLRLLPLLWGESCSVLRARRRPRLSVRCCS